MGNINRKNNLYFLNKWKKVLIIMVPLVSIMIFGIVTNFPNSKSDIVTVFLAFVLIFCIRLNARNKIEKCFRCETPEKLLKYYDRAFNKAKMVQDKDVLINYIKSTVYCYYGEFDKALELMSKIDSNSKRAYFQSLELSIKALICYLKEDEYKEGLRLSIICKQLGETSENIPGVVKSKEFYDAYIEIGELLSGNYKENIIKSLEDKFSKFPINTKILIAWCLANVYSRLGNVESSMKMINYCEKAAPYCKPLQRIV